MNLLPISQIKLYGLSKNLNQFIDLYENDNLPNKILLSGPKGLGKSTLAYHLINFVLSKNEDFSYDCKNFMINVENRSFNLTLNKSNPNIILVDVNQEKKTIDINQIRNLISNLNKSSFNNKPRFVLIDNIELLNINSINALLKILEEPSHNIIFILINNNKKILPTLLSRCLNFKIFLSNTECLDVASKLLDTDINQLINKDLVNYYMTPGNIYNLVKFAKFNKCDLKSINIKDFLSFVIKENLYKKDNLIRHLIFDYIQYFFLKTNLSFNFKTYEKYTYFLKRISDTKRFNLDDDSIFIEFEEQILNG